MSFYDVDYNMQSIEFMPPDKRVPPNLQIIRALVEPLNWLRTLLFNSYKTGATQPAWVAGTRYPKYAQVQYNKVVYSSLKDGNSDDINTAVSWEIIQRNFIGVDERIQFNGTKLILEYALNRWFLTTFRQPPAQSDIFLTTHQIPPGGFVVGGVKPSTVYRNSSSDFILNQYADSQFITLTIKIPLAVYNALSTNPIERENIVRAFADKYVTLGIFYDIQTY